MIGIVNTSNRTYTILVLFLLFIAHIPFLESDPDYFISTSRDAFTDEGLYTMPVRNFINHGHLSYTDNDALIKTPLFSLLLFLPLKLFGTELAIARLFLLCLVFGMLVLMALRKNLTLFILIFSLLGLTQYHIFHYCHYSIAEMTATISIVIAVFFIALGLTQDSGEIISILAACFILYFTWLLKLQFLYISVLPSVALVAFSFAEKIKVNRKILLSIVFTFLTFFIYFYFWFYPKKDIFAWMATGQSGSIPEFSIGIFRTIAYNIVFSLIQPKLIPFTLLFLCSVAGGYFSYKKSAAPLRATFIVGLSWVLLECHKLLMTYLPSRYMVPFFAAMGLVITCGIIMTFTTNVPTSFKIQRLIKVLAFITLTLNILLYIKTLTNRQYSIKQINNYLSHHKLEDKTVLGAWAPSLTWTSKASAFPVWVDFVNYRHPIETYKPVAIIGEGEGNDNADAILNFSINPETISDSVKHWKVGPYPLKLYWISPRVYK